MTALARQFETDKWGWHYYTEHYDRHFQHVRDAPLTLLEIGIGGYAKNGSGGNSLRMWQSYFPNALIVGLDIKDKSFCAGDRIRIYQGDQADASVLQRILDDCGPPAIVIDDGSHRPEDIRSTFAYLFPRIADDAMYAIEDLQTSYWPDWGGSVDLHDPTTSVSLIKDLIDGLKYEEFLDPDYVPAYSDQHLRSVHAYHNLVILEKGANIEGSRSGTRQRSLQRVLTARGTVPSAVDQRRACQAAREAAEISDLRPA